MQEVSQGSLKLQAHHDKIFNSGSQSMKNNFLQDQIYYLSQLRDQCKALQINLKPNSNITIHRINKPIQNLREQLSSEVVLTRRETSLAQLPLTQNFQQQLECKYQQGVVNMDKRLQKMEKLVQRQEDKNRVSAVGSKQSILNFKTVITKKIIEEFIKRSHAVQNLIKLKLSLASKVKQQKQKYHKNYFIHAKQAKMSQRQYLFQKNHKKLYRSSTLPTRLNESQIVIQRVIKNNGRNRPKYALQNNFQQIQRTIFELELDNIKCENMKLQKSIDSLKLAVSQRQNKKMLKMLSTHKELQTEESKARELLFYMLNNQRITQKIKSCSYIWANKNPSINSRNVFTSHQESIQQQRKNQWRETHLGRLKKSPSLIIKKSQELISDDREEKKEDFIFEWKLFKQEMMVYQTRSNEKTSESLQCLNGDY